MIRYPEPLRPGDRIGVTSPSSGVPRRYLPRLEFALSTLRKRGYDVTVGECMGGDSGHVSAPAVERADELQRMLLDPTIAAVVPPWGGETAIDVLDLLDWDAFTQAPPTWLVGYSDLSTLMLPLTLRTGWATLHGANLMDSPYRPADGLAHWTQVAGAELPISQRQSGVYRTGPFDVWESDPAASAYALDGVGEWEVAHDEEIEVSGRLIGGCIEVISRLTGTPFGDLPAFGREHAKDGLIIYVEAAGAEAFEICRALHGLRLAGWFAHANAIVVGRTQAPPSGEFTQREAVLDALDDLDIPILFDVECGHVAPHLPLVNGALGHLLVTDHERRIVQEWV